MDQALKPVAAAGVICLRGDTVLLVRRGKPPRLGEWSIPGGRIEWGETATAAALRELREETGVEGDLLGLVDVVDAVFPGADGPAHHYLLVDFAVRWRAGEPVAGDDAAEACFAPLSELSGFKLWRETERVIRLAYARWGGEVGLLP